MSKWKRRERWYGVDGGAACSERIFYFFSEKRRARKKERLKNLIKGDFLIICL
jgi:hypothetical protein